MEDEPKKVEVVTSEKGTLNKHDFLKAALMAAGTPIIEYLIEKLNKGDWGSIDWKHALAVGAAAGGLYLLKNVFTTTHTTITQK